MPKKTFAPLLLLLNWLSWHSNPTVSLTSPPRPCAGPIPLRSLTRSKAKISRWRCKSPFSFPTARGYFHQNSARTKPGAYACVEFTPCVKSSASGRKRLIFSLKVQFQDTEVQIILILYSSCSLQFITMSHRTVHLAGIFSSYSWDCHGKQADVR